jgi:hypothetical protein
MKDASTETSRQAGQNFIYPPITCRFGAGVMLALVMRRSRFSSKLSKARTAKKELQTSIRFPKEEIVEV